jgi:hypothetical protein
LGPRRLLPAIIALLSAMCSPASPSLPLPDGQTALSGRAPDQAVFEDRHARFCGGPSAGWNVGGDWQPGTIRLRGGGADPKARSGKKATQASDNRAKRVEAQPLAGRVVKLKRAEKQKKKGIVLAKKKLPAGPEEGTREGRLQLAIGGEEREKVQPEDKKLVRYVNELSKAMAVKDDKAVALVLEKVAVAARQTYAPKIWSVKKLETDGLALGGSFRQQRMQRAASPYSEKPIKYDGSGRELARIRARAVERLNIPNPTDAVLGIDEYSELRLALWKANATRTIPDSVNSNRELAKIGKTVIGDMVVPEDVAVKWWLTKKREKAAKEKALREAHEAESIRRYATMTFMLNQQDALRKGIVFDPEKEEERALKAARYWLVTEPEKNRRALVKAVRKDPDIHKVKLVKPKRRKGKEMTTGKRKGPRRALNLRGKRRKIRQKAGTVPKRREGKGGGKGFGSQRKKRSGIGGGSTGAKRFRKRTGR